MADLVYYTNPMSRGQIAHWALEEIALPYQTEWLSWGPKGHKSPEYLAINPMGKVPCLVHKGDVVTEAAAICLYLADAFSAKELGPSADERAAYYRWTFFAAGPVEQAITSKALGWELPKEKESTAGFGNFDATVGTLNAHVAKSDYVCGSRFTMADVYVGSAVIWGMQFGTMPKLPGLAAYAERLQNRDAYQRCKAINDKQMAAMK